MNLRPACACLWLAFLGMPPDAHACNVPVFRYAMERWPADPYQIVVYHKGGPPGPAYELLSDGAAANYSLTPIDVTTPAGQAAAGERGIAEFPWAEIYFPRTSPIRSPVWSGPLTLDRARRIIQSPSRSRLAQKLLAGEVAVWVLLTTGHPQKDRRAIDSLKTHLARASAELRIPETGVDLNGNPVAVTDFKTYPVRFTLMEVARNNPEEDLLVSSLLKSEPDLEDYDEPIAFPVFGRGRALYALVGDGIREKTIRETCESVLGWCSCEIKSMNPGTDLLIAADWSRPFGGRMVKDPELPLTGAGAFVERKPPAKPAAAAPPPDPAPPPALCERVPPARGRPIESRGPAPSPLLRNMLYLAGAAGVGILALSVILAVNAARHASNGGGRP